MLNPFKKRPAKNTEKKRTIRDSVTMECQSQAPSMPLANNQVALENLYTRSWAAGKIIDLPVNDMFVYERVISGLSDDDKETIERFAEKIELNQKIKQLIKCARLYGSAFLIIISDDNVMTAPLNLNRQIALQNLIIASRFDTSINEIDTDITSPNFGKPLYYQFNLKNSAQINVHHTRVIRVDGMMPLTINSWQNGYDQYFGISELVRCIQAINNEENISQVVDFLLSEMSMPILKSPNFREALENEKDAFENHNMTIQEFVANINNLKSTYKTTYLDSEMDLSRLEVNFGQIPELFDKFNNRLSAVSDIPQTRLFGRSPAGLNATGDADMESYATMIASMQQRLLKPIYDKLDTIIASTLNLKDKIDFSFKPLMDISSKDKALIELQNAQRDQIYLVNGAISEEEVRQNLKDNDTYANIDGDLTSLSLPDDSLEKTMINKRQINQATE